MKIQIEFQLTTLIGIAHLDQHPPEDQKDGCQNLGIYLQKN